MTSNVVDKEREAKRVVALFQNTGTATAGEIQKSVDWIMGSDCTSAEDFAHTMILAEAATRYMDSLTHPRSMGDDEVREALKAKTDMACEYCADAPVLQVDDVMEALSSLTPGKGDEITQLRAERDALREQVVRCAIWFTADDSGDGGDEIMENECRQTLAKTATLNTQEDQ